MKLKKFIAAVSAAVIAAFSTLPFTVHADRLQGASDILTDGSFEYEVVDGGYIITKCVADLITKIPDVQNGVPIVGIGDKAFAGCDGISELNLPQTIKTIGDSAFLGCSAVTSLTLPARLEKLGDNAFIGCSMISSVTIPETLTEIPTGAFRRCDRLTEIKLHDKITKIGDYAFYQCSSLAEITLPASLTELGEMALGETISLNKINTGDCTEYVLDNNMLFNKDKTKICAATAEVEGDLYIPDTVTEIAPGAFSACPAIENIFLPKSVKTIGYGAFSCQSAINIGYGTAIKKVDFSEGLESIGQGAFSYSSIESLLFPSTLKEIGSGAFSGCVKLERVVIPEGVKTIGESAFAYCEKLKNVTVPKSVTTIGENAFGYTYKNGAIVKLNDFKMSVSSGSAAEKYAKSNSIEYSASDKLLKRVAFIVIAVGIIIAVVVLGWVLMARSKKLAPAGARKAKKLAEKKAFEDSYNEILSEDEEEDDPNYEKILSDTDDIE